MAVLSGYKWGSSTQGSTGGQVTWSFATFNISGGVQFDAIISNPTYQNLIRAAFDAWEAVANIDFVEVSDSANSDIRLGWDAYDGPSGVVGQANTTYTIRSGMDQITFSEIFFDTGETWSTSPSYVGPNVNFFTTALHEIGHAIGLGHSSDPDAIMYFQTNSTVTLTADDIAGIRSIYGAAGGGGGGGGGGAINGTSGNDSLVGTAGNDVIVGFAGNDTMIGNGGNDALWAGSGDNGNDWMEGNAGNDTIGGGNGNDTLQGGTGGDLMFGGNGDDWVDVGVHNVFTSDPTSVVNTAWAGRGNDRVEGDNTTDILGGGSGNDTMRGYGGNDLFYGGANTSGETNNNDYIYGGDGNDTVYGGTGNDYISGGNGNDDLFGGSGNDTIFGGAGADDIWGGSGNDTMTGDDGSDLFGFISGSGSDLITDFEVGIDLLDISGTSTNFASTADVIAASSDSGAGLVIDLGGGSFVTLSGVTTADIAAMDFLF